MKSWLIGKDWCWEGLGAGGEGDDRGWDGWMASLTRWTWVWASSESGWWTGRPSALQSMGSQRFGYNWATELNWKTAVNIQQRYFGLHLCLWMKKIHNFLSVWNFIVIYCIFSSILWWRHGVFLKTKIFFLIKMNCLDLLICWWFCF